MSNPALNPVRFALWTLRDKAAQRWLALRWAHEQAEFSVPIDSATTKVVASFFARCRNVHHSCLCILLLHGWSVGLAYLTSGLAVLFACSVLLRRHHVALNYEITACCSLRISSVGVSARGVFEVGGARGESVALKTTSGQWGSLHRRRRVALP